MKILMLVNWKVKKSIEIPKDIQAPDYIVPGEKYWFFRYFQKDVEVDVIDISSFKFWENIERKKLHFYIVQAIKAIFKIKKYDVVLSHGMPSGIVLALFRRFIKTKAKHIVFDIGSFNSAAVDGKVLKLNQFASKSIDGIIYHSSQQIEYYKKFYPWIVEKSKFIPFGTDLEYFKRDENEEIGYIDSESINEENYILAIGYSMRDYTTLLEAFKLIDLDINLKIIGNSSISASDKRVEILGPIEKRELNLQIQKAKFCVLPLENKNFSFGQMTLLQQMYFEKAVITARVPSTMDYVEDKKNAVLYEPKNVNNLKEQIEYLINNVDKRNCIGKKAKESVTDFYDEMTMAKKIEIFIEDII